ncbi:MAG: hypothetical protein AAFV72_10000 [Cyanobacteria bacterium J06635_1]
MLAWATILGVFVNRPIEWLDTGYYHLGSVRWLSRFGTVPGIALVNQNFGKVSSWFALSAPLVPDFWESRMGAFCNGFVILLAGCHLILTLTDFKQGAQRLPDYFLTAFLSLIIVNYLFLQPAMTAEGRLILVSLSPDVAVNFLVGFVIWLVLTLEQTTDIRSVSVRSDHSPRLSLRAKSVRSDRSGLEAAMIPLLISAFAVTVKITALPLLAMSFIYYGFKRFSFYSWLTGGVVTAVLISPFLAHSIITSGCPLYPSRALCFNLPWLVPLEKAQGELQKISSGTALTHSWLGKWMSLVAGSPKLIVMLVLLCLSLLLGAIWLYQLRKCQARGQRIAILGAWLGVVFSLAVSQDNILRFGLAYFLVVPCLLPARLSAYISWGPLKRIPLIVAKPMYLTAPVFLTALAAVMMTNSVSLTSWWLPPPVPQVALVSAAANDISYVFPQDIDRGCWFSSLPCAPAENLDEVILRKPTEGLEAGFTRKSSVKKAAE